MQASDSYFLDCKCNKYQELKVIQYARGLNHFLAIGKEIILKCYVILTD